MVDDEPIVREVVCRYLAREGFRTAEAADGPAALAELARCNPVLVVLDVRCAVASVAAPTCR